MGWQHGDPPSAPSQSSVAGTPFQVPHEVSAHSGDLWLCNKGRHCSNGWASSCVWTEWQPWRKLVLKGVSWSGFDNPSINCVEELGGWMTPTSINEYLNILTPNFNAVRLPVYANGLLRNPQVNDKRCGHLGRTHLWGGATPYHSALVSVVRSLKAAGQFVVIDMHSIDGECVCVCGHRHACTIHTLAVRS